MRKAAVIVIMAFALISAYSQLRLKAPGEKRDES
jgi:hypothetical protein